MNPVLKNDIAGSASSEGAMAFSSNRMRILIFSLAYDPMIGGAEVAVKEITNRLSPQEFEFDMVTLRFDSAHPVRERIGNVNVYRVGAGKNLFPFMAARLASKLHKENPYDAAWAIMANWAGFAALFFKYFYPGVTFILTLQEGDPLEYIEGKVRLVRGLWKKIFTKADRVQAISTFLAEWAKRVGYGGEVAVIPNGVDTRKFENPSPHVTGETVRIITTSRLVEKNGVGDVIEAMKFLPANFIFQIVGTGPLEKELKEKAKTLGVGERVEFIGFALPENIPSYLHKADIFIRPSLSEGMGNSFIEAMAAGLPVIATPVGGIPDFLKNEETGLFVEPKNPRQIAFQIQKLVSDRVLRDKIVINAKRMVQERYDWDLIAEEMKARVFAKV